MAAIAPSIFLMLALAATPTPFEAVATMAEQLSSDNARGFVRMFSPSMEGYEELRRNVESLDAAYEISSSIEILGQKENTLSVDWFLELKPKSGVGQLIRRRERVSLEFQSKGKQLEVIKFQPISLFSLPEQ